MRRLGTFLVLLLFAAMARVPLPGQADDADHAYWLVGTWSCNSISSLDGGLNREGGPKATHSSGTMTFVRRADGSLSLTNIDRTRDGYHFEYDDTFQFDSAKNRWVWSSRKADGSHFEEGGSAAPWLSGNWLFEGTFKQADEIGGIRRPLRVTYVRLTDASYVRDSQFQLYGDWTSFNQSLCKRTP